MPAGSETAEAAAQEARPGRAAGVRGVNSPEAASPANRPTGRPSNPRRHATESAARALRTSNSGPGATASSTPRTGPVSGHEATKRLSALNGGPPPRRRPQATAGAGRHSAAIDEHGPPRPAGERRRVPRDRAVSGATPDAAAPRAAGPLDEAHELAARS